VGEPTRCHPTCTLTMCETLDAHNKLEYDNISRMKASIIATCIQAQAPPNQTDKRHPSSHPSSLSSPPKSSLPSFPPSFPLPSLPCQSRAAGAVGNGTPAYFLLLRRRWGVAVLWVVGGKRRVRTKRNAREVCKHHKRRGARAQAACAPADSRDAVVWQKQGRAFCSHSLILMVASGEGEAFC